MSTLADKIENIETKVEAITLDNVIAAVKELEAKVEAFVTPTPVTVDLTEVITLLKVIDAKLSISTPTA